MKIELNPFIVPNFVMAKLPLRPWQEGFHEGPTWALSEVDASDLGQLCDQFRDEVFRKAGKTDTSKWSDEVVEFNRQATRME